MEKQHSIDLDSRDKNVADLRKKVTEKDQEIDVNYQLKKKTLLYSYFYLQKLRESDIAKEAVINRLRSKSRESDQESKSEYSGARAPTNVSLRLELQKKDDVKLPKDFIS